MNIKKDTVALDILNIYVDYNASCSTGYFSSHHSFSFRTYQGKYRKDKWHQEKISSNNTNFLAMTETLVHKIHPYLKQMSPVPKLNQNVLGPNLDMNYRYQGWGYRAVTKISSSWYVTAISRRGIKQLGTFWVLFSFFFHESNQGSFTYQLGKTPGPWSLVIVLLGNKKI